MLRPEPLARAFGTVAQDLGPDFARTDRPALVTQLLAACLSPADADAWWHSPVGYRTAALLQLQQLTVQRSSVTALLRCAVPGCGTRLEVELPHERLQTLAGAPDAGASDITVTREGAPPLRLRRPTGADLLRWQQPTAHDGVDPRARMLRDLCTEGQPRPEDALAAAEALAEADPLVAFQVRCTCPACGDERDHAVDLEGLALQSLARRQQALIEEVHALASRYGWTEQEIFAVSPARRARYLALIEGWA